MIDLFTKQEKIFIGFLLFGILVGAGIQLYRFHHKAARPPNQNQELSTFEQLFAKKAILVDSLLAEATFSTSAESCSVAFKGAVNSDANSLSSLPAFRVDLNRAGIEELVKLPHIGRVIATRIIEYRSAHGDFKDIEDIMNIKGIGEKKFNAIKSYIYVQKN